MTPAASPLDALVSQNGDIAFLVDLDGTLYRGDRPLPAAVEFIEELRRQSIRFLLCSNNSSLPPRDRLERLRGLGFEVSEKDLLTSLDVLVRYLAVEHAEASALVIGTDAVREYLVRCGVRLAPNGDVVVLTYDTELTYDKLCAAHEQLAKGAPFLATHADLVCPTRAGDIPDCGSFIALLEASTGRRPVIMGKPHRPMVEAAAKALRVEPNRLVVVGDRLYTDIKMANDFRAPSLLVLTGETKREDLQAGAYQPTAVLDTLHELVSTLRERLDPAD